MNSSQREQESGQANIAESSEWDQTPYSLYLTILLSPGLYLITIQLEVSVKVSGPEENHVQMHQDHDCYQLRRTLIADALAKGFIRLKDLIDKTA